MTRIRPERIKQGNASNGQVLTYNSTTGQWVGATPADAAGYAANAYSNATTYASDAAISRAGQAYTNAVSVAATDASTKAATAYTNAISTAAADASTKAATAYTNAVANSRSYADMTFAQLANPTFIGTVAIPTLRANNSVGSAGQVLTSNGTGIYWSTAGGFTNGQSISVSNITYTTNSGTYTSANNTIQFNIAGSSTFNANVDYNASLISFNTTGINAALVYNFTIVLRIGDGITSIQWPTSVRWPNGVSGTPTIQQNTYCVFNFIKPAGDSVYLGSYATSYN